MADIMPPPPTCREYLGRTAGYCPRRPEVTSSAGTGFCIEHARERGVA